MARIATVHTHTLWMIIYYLSIICHSPERHRACGVLVELNAMLQYAVLFICKTGKHGVLCWFPERVTSWLLYGRKQNKEKQNSENNAYSEWLRPHSGSHWMRSNLIGHGAVTRLQLYMVAENGRRARASRKLEMSTTESPRNWRARNVWTEQATWDEDNDSNQACCVAFMTAYARQITPPTGARVCVSENDWWRHL